MTLSAVVITGPPGVGKSTIARAVAERYELAAHIEADRLHTMIVRGGEWPSAGTEVAKRQLVLRTTNAALLASNFLSAGVLPFIDECVATYEQLDALRCHLDDWPFVAVALRAHNDVVLARDADREKHTAANYPGIAEVIGRTWGDSVTWIDSTGRSVQETTQDVLSVISRHIPSVLR
jgi:adenylate kinase family enzyme